ncbi:MAG: DNA polymerase III subunit delta [Deltaproteobacteria bacterium]|nr:DNA polymerase III subunit delta [Deltaproteobacteria bacterium]
MKPLELQKTIQKRNLSPLYFFYGEEIYLIDKMVDEIKGIVVDPKLADFNLSVFYGKESTSQDIINSAKTFPLMSDHRLIVIKEADRLKESSLKEFSSYFADPLISTCMIICAEKMALNANLLKVFRKKGEVVRFYHPFDREIPAWIRRIANGLSKKISQEAVTQLSVELGKDLQKIYNELQKIAAYVGERKVIEGNDVKEVVADVKGSTVFNLMDCVGNRDVEGALDALKRLMESGEQPLKILRMITLRIRQLARGKEMLKEGISQAEVGSSLGIRNFFLKGFLTQVHAFSLAQAEVCTNHLFYSDWKIKSSRVNKRLILEKLIIELCGC